MKEFFLEGYDGLKLYINEYTAVTNPKAVVLVIHGMQEHCGRYAHFASMLNKNGYIVVCSDSRGHGKTMRSPEDYGRGNKDIYAETIQDQLLIIDYIKKAYKNLPIYLFGHSYGSMLSQKLLQVSKDISKIILCGTSYGINISYLAGKVLTGIMCAFGAKNKPAKPIEAMSLKTWGKPFENGNWLSREAKVFEAYQKDPLCGGSFPISFYRSLFKNMTKVNMGIKHIEPSKKILLIAGDKDPVGANGKYIIKLHKKYLKHGVDAKTILYPGARHEVLNETNKEEVYKDIVDFFNS